MTLEELKESVVSELSAELRDDADFSEAVLSSKVARVIKEIMLIRKYPQYYTDEMIAGDMEKFYPNVLKAALYDYNQIGIDFQDGHSENGVNRQFSDRSKLFYGIIPLACV